MTSVDEGRLETDLQYRVGYLATFMELSESDLKTVHAAAPLLAPLVPGLVDAVYDKLFLFDCTKRHFVPRQSGFEGDVPATVESLKMDHEQILFRKQHLGRYLVNLVTKPYDAKMFGYLDNVGKMHTPKLGSASLNVPLVQMNALLGYVADALTATILGLGLERSAEVATLRAFGKVLWLQNDLINRHYAVS